MRPERIAGAVSLLLLLSCGYPERYAGGGPPDQEAVAGIEIYLPSRKMKEGDTMAPAVLLLLAPGGKVFADPGEIAWEVSDPDVLCMSGEGVLSARAEGRATLRALFATFSASEEITVERAVDWSKLLLSEVFYDASGTDTGKEFIEIHNGGDGDVDLSGCSLVDGEKGSARFFFPEGSVIGAGRFLVIAQSREGFYLLFGSYADHSGFSFVLNNGGETVFLLGPDGSVLDCVYTEGGTADFPAVPGWGSPALPSANEGFSVQRISFEDSGTFAGWASGVPTPGQ